MDFEMPKWLDMQQILGLGVLTLMIVQYLKDSIPTKLIKPATLAVGVLMAFLSDFYVDALKDIAWFKDITNGLLAGVMSDFGYGLLSRKAGTGLFTLPSKDDLQKK